MERKKLHLCVCVGGCECVCVGKTLKYQPHSIISHGCILFTYATIPVTKLTFLPPYSHAAGNESCPQPQTSEHLAAIEIMKLKHIIILQNKIDLVRDTQAKDQQQEILKFVQGTAGPQTIWYVHSHISMQFV